MYTFKELRKASNIEIEGKKIKVAVLGNCSTQFFCKALLGYAKLQGINLNVFDADYNQIDIQLIDKKSEVYEFNPDNVILWLATDKLYEEFLDLPIEKRIDFADFYLKKIKQYWNFIGNNCKAKILQMNFTEIDDKVLGQYSAKIEYTFIYQIRKLNWLLEEAMNRESNVYPIDLFATQIKIGQEKFYDSSFYYNAKMSVSPSALPYVAAATTDVLKSMSGKIKKCIVLDLDNTLWGGVIGDDGLDNIEIGEFGRGHSFSNFQRWLKELKQMGIILAVCSKNNENTAKEPFEKHEDMILKLEDISIFIANWEDKASNIKKIQESLNIGMDSMVFVDDNSFERNLVRQMIPEIEVPEMPEDPADYLQFLQNCNYFDVVSFSLETADRTTQYRAEFERKKAEKAFLSIDEYLISLEMKGKALPFEKSKYSRIAQLTQRSNQFNLRTIRYTEDEIRKISEDSNYVTLYYTLSDKFGDHGLISVVIMKKNNSKELFIDTWLMSCRVLKRGMEEFVMDKIIEVAKTRGFSTIKAEYIPTNKNSMVKDIYKNFGFKEYEKNKYTINTDKYIKKNVFIKEEMQNG